jgi:hypothetical protein
MDWKASRRLASKINFLTNETPPQRRCFMAALKIVVKFCKAKLDAKNPQGCGFLAREGGVPTTEGGRAGGRLPPSFRVKSGCGPIDKIGFTRHTFFNN